MTAQTAETRMEVAIAVLQTNYEHIDKRLVDQSQKIDRLSEKFDAMLEKMNAEDTRSKMRARIIGAMSHVTTGGLTLLAAKLLHVPLNLG